MREDGNVDRDEDGAARRTASLDGVHVEVSAEDKHQTVASTRPDLKRLQRMKTATFPSHWEPTRVEGPWQRWFAPVVVEHAVPSEHVVARWTSRRHRKGRLPSLHPIPDEAAWGKVRHERRRTFLAPFGYRLWGWEPKRIEYWNAFFFTLGSVWWVINAFFVMWPLSNEKVNLYVGSYTGFIGGLCFWLGSYAGILEVVNKEEHVTLGWEIHHDFERLESVIRHPQKRHSGAVRRSDKQHEGGGLELSAVGSESEREKHQTTGNHLEKTVSSSAPAGKQRFKWWGWEPHNFSYAAAFVQLVGATIFSISANITGLPHVLPINYPPDGWVLWDILSWTPQCVGGLFFVANGMMAMREEQRKWLEFRPLDIGWEVGFWNVIGGVGFFLFGFFGYFRYPVKCCKRWAGEFATFWGSWAFLLSSYLLLVEVLN